MCPSCLAERASTRACRGCALKLGGGSPRLLARHRGGCVVSICRQGGSLCRCRAECTRVGRPSGSRGSCTRGGWSCWGSLGAGGWGGACRLGSGGDRVRRDHRRHPLSTGDPGGAAPPRRVLDGRGVPRSPLPRGPLRDQGGVRLAASHSARHWPTSAIGLAGTGSPNGPCTLRRHAAPRTGWPSSPPRSGRSSRLWQAKGSERSLPRASWGWGWGRSAPPWLSRLKLDRVAVIAAAGRDVGSRQQAITALAQGHPSVEQVQAARARLSMHRLPPRTQAAPRRQRPRWKPAGRRGSCPRASACCSAPRVARTGVSLGGRAAYTARHGGAPG